MQIVTRESVTNILSYGGKGAGLSIFGNVWNVEATER